MDEGELIEFDAVKSNRDILRKTTSDVLYPFVQTHMHRCRLRNGIYVNDCYWKVCCYYTECMLSRRHRRHLKDVTRWHL